MKREVLETVIEYKSREDTVLDASPYSYLDIETIDTIRQYSLQHITPYDLEYLILQTNNI